MLSIIALGSNLGNRQINIQEGIRALRILGIVTVSSCWLETPDESGLGPKYLNTATILNTSITSPQDLLEYMLRIELKLGRDRSKGSNAPRTLDLDLIAVDGVKGYWRWKTPSDLKILGQELTLELPHPRARKRLFVMKPLEYLKVNFF
jgi:2-amino-4-hydroxy-6-hydroxymethyldihydropteridine diphosphokinase